MMPSELSQQMENSGRVLLAGAGSAHGDDRIGWEIVRCLQQRFEQDICCRMMAIPLDLLDWMDGVSQLHIVDACDAGHRPGHLFRWSSKDGWSPNGAGHNFVLRSTGTHDYGIPEVLELAERLGRLPKSVTLWGIQGERFDESESISPSVAVELSETVELIAKELNHARTIAGAVTADAG